MVEGMVWTQYGKMHFLSGSGRKEMASITHAGALFLSSVSHGDKGLSFYGSGLERQKARCEFWLEHLMRGCEAEDRFLEGLDSGKDGQDNGMKRTSP